MPTMKKQGTKLPWLSSNSDDAAHSRRKNPNQKFYNSKPWRLASKLKRQANPFCEVSEHFGNTAAAEMVDHIIPINQGGAKFDERNLMSMCHRFHNIKSGKEKHNPILVEWVMSNSGKTPANKTDIFEVLKTS